MAAEPFLLFVISSFGYYCSCSEIGPKQLIHNVYFVFMLTTRKMSINCLQVFLFDEMFSDPFLFTFLFSFPGSIFHFLTWGGV